MRNQRWIRIIRVLLVCLWLIPLPVWAVSITITDPGPTWSANKEGCCPTACPECVVNAWDPIVSPVPFVGGQANGVNSFVQAWNAWIAPGQAGVGWNLLNGGTLNGTFEITQYDAGFTDCCGGVEIWIDYTPGAGDPAEDDVVWSQAIATNSKLPGALGPGNPYLDIKNPAGPDEWGPPVYPYQYLGAKFYDFPCRACPDCCDDMTWWNGFAYLSEVDYTAKTLTVYEGVDWGFDIRCVPEPGTMMLLAAGLLGWIRVKRDKNGA